VTVAPAVKFVPVIVTAVPPAIGPLFGDTLLSVGAAAFNCRAKVSETAPALAVSVAVCAVLTVETVAVNPALVAFAGTVTVAGTATAALLLDRLTTSPPLGATAFSDTVQASEPEPVMEALLQDSALKVGVARDTLALAEAAGLATLVAVTVTVCAVVMVAGAV
jgi:hypothetical protein